MTQEDVCILVYLCFQKVKSMSASLKGIFANANTRSSGVLMAKQKLRLLGFSCLQQVYFSGMECSLLLTECWLF